MNFDVLKKYLPWTAVGLPCFLALLVFIFGLINTHPVSKTFLIIASILLIALGGVFYVMFFVLSEKAKNFFLTDPDTGRSITLDKLTFSIINERLNLYIAERIEDADEMMTGEILTRRGIFGQREVYRPLIAYKILFDLAQQNDRSGWDAFYSMSDNAFTQLTNALNSANDNNMARRLMQLRQMRDNDRLGDFIVGNQRYLQGKMTQFVRANIRMFDDIAE